MITRISARSTFLISVLLIALVMSAAPAWAQVILNNGDVFDIAPGAPVTTNDVLGHLGYHINNDNLVLDLNNNGGMMAGGNPKNGPAFFGESFLTDGPDGNGLEFDNDAQFIATGSIGRNDNYSNLWLATLHVTAANAGDWQFRHDRSDDRAGIWLDLNQDGVFQSTTSGLGSDRGEQLRYENNSAVTVTLAAGDYLMAFTHREGGGGSNVDFFVQSPAMGAEEIIQPTNPDQAGFWSYTAIPDTTIGDVTVNGDSIINLQPTARGAAGMLTFANTQDDPATLTINSADGGQGLVFAGPTTLNGNGGILNLANTPVVTLNDVGGPGGLTLAGDGMLALPTANTYLGVTTISGGTVQLGNDAALGDEAGMTVIQSGGTLDIAGFRAGATGNELVQVEGTGVNGNGAINNTGAAQYSAFRRITMTGDATFRADNRWDMRNTDGASAFDMGGFTLTKVGGSELALVNTTINNPGNVIVDQGLFRIEGSTEYLGSGTITVNDSDTLDFWNNQQTHSPNIVLNNNSNLTINGGSGTGPTLTGTVTLNGMADIDTNSKTLTIEGQVTGPGGFNKGGGQTLFLTNITNDFSGAVNINAGTVSTPSEAVLVTPASAVNVNGGTLEMDGWGLTAKPVNIAGQGAAGAGAINSVNADNTITQTINMTGNAAIGSGTAGNTLTIDGQISMPVSGDLTFTGAGNIVVNTPFGNGSAPGLFDGIEETLFDAQDVSGANPRDNIEGYRSAALGPNDAHGVLTSHLHYDNDAAFDARATALGVPGWDPNNGPASGDDYSALWVTSFTPNEDGAWGFRFNHEDDNASMWIDDDQNGIFEATANRFYDRGCCGGSGDQFTPSLTAGQTYLLGIVMNDTGGGGDFRDMEFKAPSGNWTDLDPSANPGLFQATTTPDNGLIKSGPGTLTLNAANTYNGTTTIEGGTLLAANSGALGTTDGSAATGVSVGSGGTLALQGNISIGDEHLTLAGGGAAIRNLGGDNSMATQTIVVQDSASAADQVTIQSDSGSLTLGPGGTFDLNYSQLHVDGAGDTTIHQAISAQPIGSTLTVSTPGIQETIFNDATPGSASNPRGDIEGYRTEALSIGADDGQGVLTAHLHYDNDAAVSTRAAALGAVGFNDGDFAMLWVTEFTPNEDGAWGFRFNHEDDNASMWIDDDQNGMFEATADRFYDRGCCAGSGDQFTPALTAGQTYLLGIVMNDTGGGGDFRDMEFMAPSGAWTDLDPSASSFFNLSSTVAAPTQYHLIKNGTGTLRLMGDNTYDGQTDVQEGTLLIDGTTSGQGSYTVAPGASLGGSGTVGLAPGNSVMIAGGATLLPGDNGVGVLRIEGDLLLEDGSVLDWESGAGAGNYDQIEVFGTLTLNAWTLALNDAGGGEPQPGDKFYLFTGFDELLGPNTATIDGSRVPWDTSALSIGVDAGGVFLTSATTAIPEPSTLALAALGLLGLAFFARRRRVCA